jgi:hypothetical protein
LTIFKLKSMLPNCHLFDSEGFRHEPGRKIHDPPLVLSPGQSEAQQQALQLELQNYCALEEQYKAIESQMKQSRLRFTELAYQAAPIRQLPDELLIEIFSNDDLAGGASFSEQEELTRIMLVCTRWRDIAISTPTFWTTIDLGVNRSRRFQIPEPERLARWIKYSQKSPLDVHANYTDASYPYPTETIESSKMGLKVLFEAGDRWRTLSMSGSKIALFNDGIFQQRKSFPGMTPATRNNPGIIVLPSLHTLKLVSVAERDLDLTPSVRLVMPRVRTVTLIDIQLRRFSFFSWVDESPDFHKLSVTNMRVVEDGAFNKIDYSRLCVQSIECDERSLTSIMEVARQVRFLAEFLLFCPAIRELKLSAVAALDALPILLARMVLPNPFNNVTKLHLVFSMAHNSSLEGSDEVASAFPRLKTLIFEEQPFTYPGYDGSHIPYMRKLHDPSFLSVSNKLFLFASELATYQIHLEILRFKTMAIPVKEFLSMVARVEDRTTRDTGFTPQSTPKPKTSYMSIHILQCQIFREVPDAEGGSSEIKAESVDAEDFEWSVKRAAPSINLLLR